MSIVAVGSGKVERVAMVMGSFMLKENMESIQALTDIPTKPL